MKVLGICASPRGSKSSTLRLVQAALDGAKASGAEVELVDVCELDIKFCNACQVCFKKGECVHKDDFQGLYNKILAADGLVWGSPNYFHTVTAQMKTLIDRMADAIHCQLLTGKYCCNVASGGNNYDQVTTYLDGLSSTSEHSSREAWERPCPAGPLPMKRRRRSPLFLERPWRKISRASATTSSRG